MVVATAPARPRIPVMVTLSLALLAVSFAPIFIRISEQELSPNSTVFNRMFIFALVFGLGQWLRRGANDRPSPPSTPLEGAAIDPTPTPLSLRQILLLGSVGVVAVITLVLWAMSLEYTTVAKSMLLNNLTPVFTTLGGWLFLRQRFKGQFLLGMAIALAGAIALGFEDLHGAEGTLLGDFYALLSAVFLGAYFLIVEQLRLNFSATTILLWRCAVGSTLLLPLIWFQGHQIFPTQLAPWLAVIGLGLVSEGLGQRLLADCMKQVSSSFISIFLLLEPIISALLAWVIFLEHLSPMTWVGFAVILTGIYLAKTGQEESTAELYAMEEISSLP